MDTGLKVKEKLLSTETDFWKRGARTSWILTVRNEVIRGNMGITQTMLEKMENNMLQWQTQVQMENNRWPKWIMPWSRGGRRKGQPKMGKESGKGYESEEFNIWQCNKQRNMVTENQWQRDEIQKEAFFKCVVHWVQFSGLPCRSVPRHLGQLLNSWSFFDSDNATTIR